MRKLGMWQRLAIVLTTFGVLIYGLGTYRDLSATAAQQRLMAAQWCPPGNGRCVAGYVSEWARSSEPVLALYALAVAMLAALVLWAAMGVLWLAARWILAGRGHAAG